MRRGRCLCFRPHALALLTSGQALESDVKVAAEIADPADKTSSILRFSLGDLAGVSFACGCAPEFQRDLMARWYKLFS